MFSHFRFSTYVLSLVVGGRNFRLLANHFCFSSFKKGDVFTCFILMFLPMISLSLSYDRPDGYCSTMFHDSPLEMAQCTITSIETAAYMECDNNGTDDWTDDWFEIDVRVNYTDRPGSGNLRLTSPYLYDPSGEIVILATNTNNHNSTTNNGFHYFLAVKLKAELQQNPIEFTAEFIDLNGGVCCSETNPDAGPIWNTQTGARVPTRSQCSVCVGSGNGNGYPLCWPEEDPNLITDPCNISSNNGPDPDFPEHTPIRYIKVVLHIFQKTDPNDPGNFTNADMDLIRSWFTDPNGVNKQWSTGLCADPTSTSPVMTDARIRVINEGKEGEDVFFYQDDAAWGMGFYPGISSTIFANAITNYVSTISDVETLNAFHVFMAGVSEEPNGDINPCPTAYTSFPGQACINSPAFVISGNYSIYLSQGEEPKPCWTHYSQEEGDAGLGNNMLGEMYHVLGVDHLSPLQAHTVHFDIANTGDGCNDTPISMESVNLTGCNFNAGRCALSQCQIGKMYQVLNSANSGYERFLVGYHPDGSPMFSMTETNCNIVDADIVVPSGADVLWAGPKSLRSNVIIEPGAKLTITCDIGLPENAHITVKPQGHLVVDGARLYNNCDGTFWEGIVVEGQPFGGDVPGQQGYCQLRPGTTIEDANIGVRCESGFQTSGSGGIVQALLATFLNCQEHAVKIVNDGNTPPGSNAPTGDANHFSACRFIVDGSYQSSMAEFTSLVHLQSVQGVSFFWM